MGAAWVLYAVLLAAPAPAQPEPQGAQTERLRTAKELFFDRKYPQARAAWQEILGVERVGIVTEGMRRP